MAVNPSFAYFLGGISILLRKFRGNQSFAAFACKDIFATFLSTHNSRNTAPPCTVLTLLFSPSWVLQCLDNVGQDSQCSNPPCAIVPLGTGIRSAITALSQHSDNLRLWQVTTSPGSSDGAPAMVGTRIH